jgi:hypothetical protein
LLAACGKKGGLASVEQVLVEQFNRIRLPSCQ